MTSISEQILEFLNKEIIIDPDHPKINETGPIDRNSQARNLLLDEIQRIVEPLKPDCIMGIFDHALFLLFTADRLDIVHSQAIKFFGEDGTPLAAIDEDNLKIAQSNLGRQYRIVLLDDLINEGLTGKTVGAAIASLNQSILGENKDQKVAPFIIEDAVFITAIADRNGIQALADLGIRVHSLSTYSPDTKTFSKGIGPHVEQSPAASAARADTDSTAEQRFKYSLRNTSIHTSGASRPHSSRPGGVQARLNQLDRLAI